MTEQRQPEISIIVPVYKVEKYLNECIDSILAQTFTDFEVILVDDGSPDSCPALCDAAAARDSRVRVIHKPNGGVSTARNAGLDVAKGNWIGFVDSDDRINSEFYMRLYSAAKSWNADVAACDFRMIDEDGKSLNDGIHRMLDETLTAKQALARIVTMGFQVLWNKLYRKELFQNLQFPVGKQNEDTSLIPVLLGGGKIDRVACISDRLYDYRMREKSITHTGCTLKEVDRVEANYRMFRCLAENEISDVLLAGWRILYFDVKGLRKRLPKQDCTSVRMREAEAYCNEAFRTVLRCGGLTPQAIVYNCLNVLSDEKYLRYRHKQEEKQRRKQKR